jgi:hypothetical protein
MEKGSVKASCAAHFSLTEQDIYNSSPEGERYLEAKADLQKFSLGPQLVFCWFLNTFGGYGLCLLWWWCRITCLIRKEDSMVLNLKGGER